MCASPRPCGGTSPDGQRLKVAWEARTTETPSDRNTFGQKHLQTPFSAHGGGGVSVLRHLVSGRGRVSRNAGVARAGDPRHRPQQLPPLSTASIAKPTSASEVGSGTGVTLIESI